MPNTCLRSPPAALGTLSGHRAATADDVVRALCRPGPLSSYADPLRHGFCLHVYLPNRPLCDDPAEDGHCNDGMSREQ